MVRRFVVLIVLIAGTPLFTSAREPTVEAVDYSTPKSHLALPASLGNREQIEKQGAALVGRDDRATVRAVLAWGDANLKCDPNAAYVWRAFDEIVRSGLYGGCADQSIVVGALLRAAGIPTIWVKTMDVAWIWDFKKGRPFESWSGHVFLEIYLDGKWVLLDPGGKTIYADYSPKMRILPGNRFAYDKGDDPRAMIISTQWEEWKAQARSYFERLDVAALPVDAKGATSIVPQVDIIGNDPYYQVLSAMANRRGWTVRQTFNTDYEKLLPQSRGRTLLVETHGGKPIVSIDVLNKFFPKASEGLNAEDGIVVIDGTTIMFVDLDKALDALDGEGMTKD